MLKPGLMNVDLCRPHISIMKVENYIFVKEGFVSEKDIVVKFACSLFSNVPQNKLAKCPPGFMIRTMYVSNGLVGVVLDALFSRQGG